jgi:hypothetical protein
LLAEHLGLEESEIPPLLDKHGAMAAMIAALGDDRPRSLRPLEVRPLTEIERTMADGEVLDPETPKEMFDFLQARRGLFRRRGLLSRAMARRRRKQGTR